MRGKGFQRVFNLAGGIKAWEGPGRAWKDRVEKSLNE
jgi:rhodanese-related sulfurtransferase